MAASRSNTRVIRFAVFAVLLITCGYILSTGSSYKVPSSASESPVNVQAQAPSHGDIPVPGQDQEQKTSQEGVEIQPHSNSKPGEKQKATFVALARNSDLRGFLNSIRQIEDRFNHRYQYDWVFLNDEEFSDEFKEMTTAVVSGKAKYGLIPKEHWSYPDWIDKEKAALAREQMVEKKIIYGGSVSYRHMCRFESGFFFRHPLLDEYEYYWRVDPDIKIYCDIDYDIFKFMKENNKKYSFTITLPEYKETIPTLWDTTKEFIKNNEKFLAKDSLFEWISNDNGETYNGCHFWSNFEVASLDFLRSEAYMNYFDHLDKAGGFFYERWGDAPVHSIAVALFLNKDEVHFFNDLGYYHVPFHNCPVDPEIRKQKRCVCNPEEDFTWKDYSCTKKYHNVKGLPRMKGWENFSG